MKGYETKGRSSREERLVTKAKHRPGLFSVVPVVVVAVTLFPLACNPDLS